MPTNNKVYSVPMAVATSLNSGRGMFSSLYARQVRDGIEKPNKETVAEMVELIGDLVEDVQELRARQAQLIDAMGEFYLLSDSLCSLRAKFNEIKGVFEELTEKAEGYDPIGGGGGHGRSDLPHGMGGGGDD